MAINSKQKGARGERQLANKLKEYGFDCRRGCQYNGSDGSADVIGLPNIHIECKFVEALSLYKALSQAKGDAKDGDMPVVMHRKNNCEWVVIQPLETWIEMYKEYQK